MNAKDRAQHLYQHLEVAKRDNGEPFVRLKEGHPDWMQDVIRDAHGDMLPDDTRYRMIRDVLSCLTDHDVDEWEDGDTAHEVCDSLVDVYTSQLTAWLASHLDRVGYMTAAQDEFGHADSVDRQIAMGQLAEYEEIYQSLVASLLALDEEE